MSIDREEVGAVRRSDRVFRFGSAAAALVSAGAGCFVIGLLTTLAEASGDVADALRWWNSVGPLSGKVLTGVAAWVVVWFILWLVWRKRDVSLRVAFWVMIGLIVVGLLLTFPPIFELTASE